MAIDGIRRWWLVHEPASRSSAGPLPVVLVLHGGGGNPRNAEMMSGMSALADREGFLAVYPAGSGRFKRRLLTWNAGNCCGYALDRGVDDAAFLAALIERLIKEGRADPKRVFMTGMSNGAMMAQRFACERAGLVAAIAPVAGQLNVGTCKPSRPVAVLMIHGLEDEHAPYAGGAGKKMLKPRVDRSVAASAAMWERAGSSVTVLSHPGGHVWPGGKAGRRYGNVDPALPEPRASEEMWRFFMEHARR
ncbi:MAG: polyhydroxybutyrate depolymerase [Elusimicrobia bacterium CG11_big_fil_rev_8_21_14_0_20_64_6]|nr:MAG: polyhydroxybutyrate depolymerase [Elusimicrobia bacterium CG11_big_fil_rev_8_21_14_0_20_64_6]